MKKRELLGNLSYLVRIKNKIFSRGNKIRVLMYHDIPSDQLIRFEQQIILLKSKGYQFLDLSGFIKAVNNENKLKSIGLLITFDDGFESNYEAVKILDEYNIKSILFIPSSFMEKETVRDQKRFIITNLFKDGLIEDNISKEMKPLSYEQLIKIVAGGHTIGSHTCNHICISESDCGVIHNELSHSKEILEKHLKIQISCWAYPFGDIDSISSSGLSISKAYYKYTFSAVRGFNSKKNSNYLFYRDEVSPKYSSRYLQFIVEGGLDIKYSNARYRLKLKKINIDNIH